MYDYDEQDGKVIEAVSVNVNAVKKQNEMRRELNAMGESKLNNQMKLKMSIPIALYHEYCKNAGIPRERLLNMTQDEKKAMLKHFESNEYRAIQH